MPRRRSLLPRDPLERLRALFLTLSFAAAIVLAVRTWTSDRSLPAHLAVTAALVAMAASQLVCYRRRAMHPAVLVLDAVALLAMGTALGGPGMIAGYVFVSVGLRSLYVPGRSGVAPTLVYCGAVLMDLIIVGLPEAVQDPRITQLPGMLFSGLAMWLVAASLDRQQQALSNERLLAGTGLALVAAADRQAIKAAAAQAAETLLKGRPVELLEPGETAGEPALAIPLRGHQQLIGQVAVLGEGPLPERAREPLSALSTLLALRLEADAATEARARGLIELNQFKDDLLDVISHELRTPMASIQAFAELLQNYDVGPAEQQEFLDIITSESQRLSRLIDDMLDLAKIQSGRLELHGAALDVAALVHDAARIHAPLVERDGLAFEVTVAPDLPPVQGDRDRLLQVMGNLLSNARKFTIQGTVALAAWQEGAEVRIGVTDTGLGIPVAAREQIFERFTQATPVPSGKPRGTGLGLAICRELVEQHGGRIWTEDGPDGGSAFFIALPAVERPEPPSESLLDSAVAS